MSWKFYNFFACFLFAASFVFAQPIMTVESQTPTIGETYEVQYSEIQFFQPGPGGANQVWDFSELELNAFELEFSILAPGDGLSSQDFPDADFVWYLNAFDAYNFYQVTDTGLDLIGGATGTEGDILFLEIFDDAEDGYQLPSTYLDEYTYYSAFTSYFFGISTFNERNGEVEIDGYGTIILPDGTTYDNVLRMVISSVTTAFPIMETQYAWILPGQFVPVMVYSFNDDDESVPSIYYSKRNVETSVKDLAQTDLGVRVLQNPVRDQLRLAFTDPMEELRLEIVNTLGVTQSCVSTNNQIDVQSLSAGTYFLVATSDEGRQTIPFVKQ